MAKRKPTPEFTRSANSHPVTLADGTKVQLAHQLKRGIAASFWYYLQWPCGGWREFDVRWLYPEGQEEQVEAELNVVMLSPDPAVRCTILTTVAERLSAFRFDDVKKASF
ncbi:MAG: hypothetical protein ACRYFX_04885 [Janthinobacterium lividum]